MKFHSTPQSNVAPFIADRIIKKLQEGKKVLWLLSGGSGSSICIEASKLLAGHDLSNLFVTMSDERYGDIGHPDENIAQLLQMNLQLPGATLYRPLNGSDRPETARMFSLWLKDITQKVDYKIATLGVGEDGHTCGIKPHSTAVTSQSIVEDSQGEDFERITITLQLLRQLDEAVVQIYGISKHSIVNQLLTGSGDTNDYPMLAIRDIPEVNIFSDYKEEQ